MDKRLGKCFVSMRWALWKDQQSQTQPVRNILVVAPISAIPDWLSEIESDGLCGMLWKDLARPNQHRTVVNAHLLKESESVPLFTLCNKETLFKAKGRGTKCELCEGSGEGLVEGEDVPCYRCGGKGRISSRHPIPAGPLTELSWDAVIFDESSAIRNPTSQVTWVANNVLSKIPYRAILSGEPAPSGSPMDYFEQMRFLYGSFMGHTNFWRWRDENFQQIRWDWEPKPGRLTAIREAVQSRAVILTRHQAGLSNVKTFEHRFVELPPKVRKEYDESEKLFVIGGEHEVTCTLPVQTHLARLAGGFPVDYTQFRSDHKVKLLLELLKGEYANQHMIVLFRFNQELIEVSKTLKKAGIKSTYLTGETKIEDRRLRMEKFRKGHLKVLLAQLKVFKFGIDASVCDTMVLYSLSYDPEDVSQALDRIAHPKKTTPLHYIYLITSDTKDQDIVESYEEKKVGARLFMRRILDKQRMRVLVKTAEKEGRLK